MIESVTTIPLNISKILLAFLLVLSGSLSSQPPLFKSPVYIERYQEEAVNQMMEYKIPASVILAQAIFESNCGTSDLAKKSNNHFGIKCHMQWNGDTIVKTDDSEGECFRKYNSVEDSYTDHSLFLRSRARYADLFRNSITDYRSWCIGLKASGYATYPLYAEELIKIIESNRLYEIDGPEKLESGTIQLKAEREIVKSKFPFKQISPLRVLRTEALFVDERDVIIQSMELQLNRELP
jgi:hypothetical protein